MRINFRGHLEIEELDRLDKVLRMNDAEKTDTQKLLTKLSRLLSKYDHALYLNAAQLKSLEHPDE